MKEEFRTKKELLSEIAQLEEKLSKLENSESKFSLWLENSPICTKILDLDFKLQYMSSSGIKDLKIDNINEFYGKPYPFNFNPDSIKIPLTENLKRARETGETITQEAPMQDIEGNILWYQTTIVPVCNDDNQPDHIMVVSINTTERKQAENDLKKSRSFLDSIYNGTNLAITVTDINETGEFQLTGVNKQHENTFGIKNEEYAGKTPKQLEKVFGKEIIDFTSEKFDLCVKTKSVLEYELEVPDISGKPIIWSSKMTPIFDHHGKVCRIITISDDITQRKQEKLALEKSYILLKSAERFAHIGSWEWDIKEDNFLMSDEWLHIHGVSNRNITKDELIPIAHPDDAKAVNKNFDDAIKGVGPYDITHRIIRQDNGKERIVSAKGIVSFDKNGKAYRMLGTAQDITEFKQAEEKILTAERKLKDTFDISPSIISKADLNTGYFVEVNQAVTRILGYSSDEFTSKPLIEFIHPDDRQKTVDVISEQQKGAEVNFFENRYLCKNGLYKWMAWHATKADKNGIVTAIASDISERKIVEQEIIQTKQFYENIIEGVQDGIWVSDKNDVIYFANTAMDKIAGVPKSQIQGKNILKDFSVETTREFNKFYKQAKKEKKPVWYDIQVKTPSNRDTWQNGWLIPQYQGNDFAGIICTIRDVTKRKQAEKELNKALEKALESDRLKSAFLANMSHEIRTPMNGIMGFVTLLSKPNLSKAQLDKYSTIISKSSNRLLNTINDIIDISKIEAGEMLVSNTETNINSVMAELLSFHSRETKLKGLTLSIEPSLPKKQVRIITDSHKLHGILTNLIKNSIKYTEKGNINFGYYVKENFIEFFVKDTGIGIPENRMQAIFNRFEQADIEDTRAYQGSGLGLAISKAYLEMLGGEIFVESEEGIGTKFTFTIPNIKITKNEIAINIINPESEPIIIKNLNVLIVEDDEVSSELLETMLEGRFRKIYFVQTGKEAIEICSVNQEIDLIFMDIKLPEMDGFTATKQIRKFNKDIIIIAQTAYALLGDRNKALAAGCNDYISKPIDINSLLDMIHKHI